jgi:tetratricopeptide (TPR) repeat protein
MSSKKENPNLFEIRFYEKLVAKRPDFKEALMALGDLYTREGLHAEGLRIDQRLASLKPEDPIVLYNLACSYSLLNHIELSLEMLKKAVHCGYRDFGYIREDDDLTNLRKDERFQEYFKNIK